MFQLNENFRSDTFALCGIHELATHPVNSFLHAEQTKTVMLFQRIKNRARRPQGEAESYLH